MSNDVTVRLGKGSDFQSRMIAYDCFVDDIKIGTMERNELEKTFTVSGGTRTLSVVASDARSSLISLFKSDKLEIRLRPKTSVQIECGVLNDPWAMIRVHSGLVLIAIPLGFWGFVNASFSAHDMNAVAIGLAAATVATIALFNPIVKLLKPKHKNMLYVKQVGDGQQS